MKITISKSILENILIHAGPFLEKKDTSQITSHVYLNVSDLKLTLRATDFEIGYEVVTDKINVLQEGSVTANGKKFLDIIRILKDGNINLEVKNEILYISQAHSNFKLPTFSHSEFPSFPTYEGKARISINSLSLIDSLKKITPAIDTNNPKFELNGALIEIKQDVINFASTDTRRLAVVTLQNQSSSELSVILPKKAIIEIQKLFFDNIEIYYDETNLIIHSDQYTFFTKLINGKFPEYSRIIPKEIANSLILPKAIMIESIKQITTISTDVKITFLNDLILFESLSDDNIEAKTEINFNTGFSTPFTIAINSRYLLDFLSSINNSEFTIGLNEGNLPFILSDENFKTVIMPIVI
ncbi:MAG: DNA polymerase III subunit beta [Epsilonproteobacteria bacterium]|nr:DNA polymerase III subunit beta [Campylobacterota bacterium]OIO17982.1 MAG: DNA polymerase III subunit beta [Helicobacteraceae bacterium CG1_02_36_14]PIP09991.1 MAG: DNA polymerase III subunit beta [Sulfurimonas sp. CG23_combo_of_CG06-09_8_20_14_all_36_33]PIS25230.1 MAG: DNA polymerase III subunit beta [Sulfurimonas sp. CG08_land_8_20_14_0_20_36_33]PIU35364.1 MAG: DNA polymerase III subunit beta [Sulfurimonas sp. CG07_land_8_20_14_0_80_36_56]PIV05181.1 MAG: DNA polymerase III subunit beta [